MWAWVRRRGAGQEEEEEEDGEGRRRIKACALPAKATKMTMISRGSWNVIFLLLARRCAGP